MNPYAKSIADALLAKWVSDANNDGAYTLHLNTAQTEMFFADLVSLLIPSISRVNERADLLRIQRDSLLTGKVPDGTSRLVTEHRQATEARDELLRIVADLKERENRKDSEINRLRGLLDTVAVYARQASFPPTTPPQNPAPPA